jgi:hypothetical protein
VTTEKVIAAISERALTMLLQILDRFLLIYDLFVEVLPFAISD